MAIKRQPTPTPRKASFITRKRQAPSQLPPSYEQLQALLNAQQLANQAPNPNTGRRANNRLSSVAPSPQLPTLPQLGNPGASQVVVPGQAVSQVAPRPGGQTVAAFHAVRKAASRHRWELTPAYATVTTIGAAAVIPGPATIGMTTAALLALAAAHKLSDTVGGRVWLSKLERHVAARWLSGAAGWTSGVWVASSAGMHWTGLSVGFAAAALGAVTGPQTAAWLRSRRIRDTADEDVELSEQAKALLVAWPHTIGSPTGPEKLQGSHIVPSTLREPSPGTIAFAVNLRDDVHAEDAVSPELRKHLERVLRMGIGTVDLNVDREDSGQVQVTLTPTRHLEKVAAVWDGPILNEDGTIDLAITADGREVPVALFNESGVESAMVAGTSNVGKSFTLAAMLLPGVCSNLEVVFYIDGGQGTSAPHLAGACDWWAVEGPDEWAQVIESAHAIMRARKARRKLEQRGPGAGSGRGLSKWRGRAEKDPILSLVIDEATTAKGQLPEPLQDLVLEMLREGRKLGVRVIQVVHDPMGEDLFGGRKARDFMAGNGAMIGHRPGGGVANMLAGSGTAEKVNLLALPPEPGWVGIIRRGQVAAHAARVKYATEEKVEEITASTTPRTLSGADLAAAGLHYAGRVQGRHTLDETSIEEDAQPTVDPTLAHSTPPAAPAAPVARVEPKKTGIDAVTNAVAQFQKQRGEMTAISIMSELRAASESGVSTAELVDRLGLAKATVNRQLKAFTDEGLVERGKDGRARLLQAAA
jgi:DNA-binding transcriptional ArsR family regulator